MTARTRTDVLLITGFCAFLFFYGLNQFGLIGADEPRYAQVAREMLDRHDWITPVLWGQPWLEKPPLYYWQAMLAYSIFGASDWSARLPSAIDATALVVAVYFFFRRFRRGAELDAALITASSAGIIGYARAASMDMALAAAFSIAMLSWWAWRESASRIYLVAFYGFLALGTLAKGPVAPFLAGLIIVVLAALVRDWRLIARTLWLPGILAFCGLALPWYFAVQAQNPGFFRQFILEHNLARFSTDLYHHREPFWYYLPVMLLALLPWTIFTIGALIQPLRICWKERKARQAEPDLECQFNLFACCWLIVPVVFFSISQSKLPGYILLAVPAGAVLLADYLRRRLEHSDSPPVPLPTAVLHPLLASATFVPALLVARIVSEHHLPTGRPLVISLAIALALAAGIALTLVSKLGLRMLRFVTLIPVILTCAAVLKIGSAALDRSLSARPLSHEIAAMETRTFTLAVWRVSRELEYGLTFYRNQLTMRYEWGKVPQEEHLLIAPENSQAEVAKQVPGRRVSFLGHYAAQKVDYFWISAANTATHE